MLLFIDFEKAFDSLEWDFLLIVLEAQILVLILLHGFQYCMLTVIAV